jgi:hypothetical protein
MIRFLVILFLSIGFMLEGLAQTEKQFLPSELKQKTVVNEPPTLYKGLFKLGMTYSWTSVDKWFNDSGKKIPVPGSGYYMTRSITTDLRYGVTNRFTVHLGIPYMFYHMYESAEGRFNLRDSVFLTNWNRKGDGIGDIDIGGDYQIVEENAIFPALTLKTYVTIPTGRKNPENIVSQYEYKEPTGKGVYSLMGILQARKTIYPLSYDLSLFYSYYAYGKKVQEPGEDASGFKSGAIAQLAGTIGYQVNDWICLNNMLSYNHKAGDKYDDPNRAYLEYKSQSLDYYFYLYFQIKQLRLVQSVSVPLWGRSWGADPGYFIMVGYAF